MKQKLANQLTVYRMELNEINSNGSLPCPGCGAHISPDDKSEQVYTLLDIRMSYYGLDEIVIRCNRCGCEINVAGFSAIEELLSKRKH